MNTHVNSNVGTILLAVLAVMLLAAIPITMVFVPPAVIELPMPVGQAAAAQNAAAQLPAAKTVEFILKTQVGGTPTMAFVGVGGEIDGKINPELKVLRTVNLD